MTVTYERTIVIKTNNGNTLTITVKEGKITAVYKNNVVTIEKYSDLDTAVEVIYALTKRSHHIYKKEIRKALSLGGLSDDGDS